MDDYLGEVEVPLKKTPFKRFTAKDWALHYAFCYGQIDGDHHGRWVVDQMARILMGTPVIVKLAKWGNGEKEYRFETGKPSAEYNKWVKKYKNRGEYSYDEGIAP
jgi:hypothetical protein